MFASLGHWNTAVYVVLALHFVPVWLVSSVFIPFTFLDQVSISKTSASNCSWEQELYLWQLFPISPNQYHPHSILVSWLYQIVTILESYHPLPVLPIILSPGGHLGSCQTALQMSSAPSSICIKLFAIVDNNYYPNTIYCKKWSSKQWRVFSLQKPSACLICVPPALMALTSIGILLPSTGKVGRQYNHYH